MSSMNAVIYNGMPWKSKLMHDACELAEGVWSFRYSNNRIGRKPLFREYIDCCICCWVLIALIPQRPILFT